MKKYPNLYIATAIALSLPFLAAAQTPTATAEVNASASVDVGPDGKPPVGRPLPPGLPQGVPQALTAEMKARLLEAEKNGRVLPPGIASTTRPGVLPIIRKEIQEDRLMMRDGSSTRPLPPMLTPLMKRLASTTMMDREALKEKLDEYRQDRKDARLDIFAAKQNFLVEQLTRALDNLKQIRERISSRIDKAVAESKDMTAPKALLVTADAKISAAGVAIQALAAYTPPAAQTSAVIEASSTVDLERPRQIGADAIKAVNDARKALNDVVRSIAQALGLKLGQEGSTTPPTTTQ